MYRGLICTGTASMLASLKIEKKRKKIAIMLSNGRIVELSHLEAL